VPFITWNDELSVGIESIDEQHKMLINIINSLHDALKEGNAQNNIESLFDYLNILDNILHPYRINSALRIKKEVRQRAQVLAEEMGIGSKLKRYPHELSQGEKQRAAICRALLPNPKIILADEATGNLDPKNKIKILDLLFRAVDENGATLIGVTHDYELIDRFDRVVDFNDFRF